MTPERKAAWIRGTFSFILIAAAAISAWYFVWPASGGAKKPAPTTTTDPKILLALKAEKNCLVVVHCHDADSTDSGQVAESMAELDGKFGPEVKFVQVDTQKSPTLAMQEGAPKEGSQANFYIESRKVFQFRGFWPKEKIEQKINELLRGLIKRTRKGWLPEVEGLQQGGDEVIRVEPPDPQK